MKLCLLPVYSKLASPELTRRILRGRMLPEGLELREHQALTLEALEDPNVDVVTNTAMTGDGKSLAAYLRALLGAADGLPRSVLGLYPTIELSKDQQRQFADYQDRFQTGLASESVWGAKLSLLESGAFGGRANALLTLLRTHDVLLTNPDIFTRVMNFQYQSGVFTREELPWTAITHFHLLLFDEFHLFSMPQFASAMTALVYAQEHVGKWRPKALFSSATQHPSLLRLIERVGLRQRVIASAYATQETIGYQQILHATDLHVHQLAANQVVETWVRQHINIIEDAWRESDKQDPRIAIIVSSVAAARRIAGFLRERFGPSALKPGGLKVSEITGLTHGSLDADIIVGTSTIDVGVDFHINLLIFEASSAGQFLQRLGRLGRFHGAYKTFANYSAHALISAKTPWISQRLDSALRDAGVQDGDIVDRQTTLHNAVEASFPSESDFEPYAHRWGALQGEHTIHVLRHVLREHGDGHSPYESLAVSLEPRYARLFEWKDMRPIKALYYRLRNDKVEGTALLEEVLSFRGSSPFQAAMLDASQASLGAESFTSYSLFFVVQATIWHRLSEEEFLWKLRAAVAPSQYDQEVREFQWVLRDKRERMLCMQVSGFLEERESLVLGLDRRLEDEHMLDRSVVLKGFYIEEPRANAAVSEVNSILAGRRVVCYVTSRTISDLRRLNLPALFPLYRLRVRGMRDLCTATFGKQALMLDSLLRSQRRRHRAGSTDRPIFC